MLVHNDVEDFLFSFAVVDSERQLNIKKVLVSGGSLDHRVAPQTLNEGVGEKVAILALDEAGRVSAAANQDKMKLFFIYFLVVKRKRCYEDIAAVDQDRR